MITEDDVKKIFAAAQEAHPEGMARLFMGWPLDKRETFAALNMMGLASRLQPLHLESAQHQSMVVGLSFKLADLAIAECEKK